MDAQGAYVALRSATEPGADGTRLYAPAHPALSAGGAYEVGGARYVSFSPCGRTLLAYFPLQTRPEAQRSFLPAGAAMGLEGLTPSAHAMAFAPTPTGSMSVSAWHADHGMCCVWTQSAVDPGQWRLVQTMPVSDASTPPTSHSLHGDLIDVCWLGAPRVWSVDTDLAAPTCSFRRAPAAGPASLLVHDARDGEQDEQVVLLTTSTGQHSVLHRLAGPAAPAPDRPLYRVQHGWLGAQSVLPPPATLEQAPVPSDLDARSAIVHCTVRAVPHEPVVLVAYQTADDRTQLRLTQVQLALDGEMSFFTLHLLPSITVTQPGKYEPVLQMQWMPNQAHLDLVLSAAIREPGTATGTHLSAWRAARASPTAVDWVRAPTYQSLELRTAVVLPECMVTGLYPPDAVASIASTTALYRDEERWGSFELDSLQYTPGRPIPARALSRSIVCPSPVGLLGYTVLSTGEAARLAFPLASMPLVPSVGRLLALALLRRVQAGDVAGWMRLSTPPPLPNIVQEAAHALGFVHTARPKPTISQLVQLAQGASALCVPTDPVAARIALISTLGRAHTALLRARKEPSTAHLLTQLQQGTSVAFTLSHAWELVWIWQYIHDTLTHAVRHAMQSSGPEPALDVLVFADVAQLWNEVLAGCVLFSNAMHASTDIDVRTLPMPSAPAVRASYQDQAETRALVRRALDGIRHASSVDLVRAVEWAPSSPASTLPWYDLFRASPSIPAADAAHALGTALLQVDAQIVVRPYRVWHGARCVLGAASLGAAGRMDTRAG